MTEETPNDQELYPLEQDQVLADASTAAQQLLGQEVLPVADASAEIRTTEVLDDQGFSRQRYDLGDDVQIIFRGKEELPTFSGSGTEVAMDVLTTDELPARTSKEAYTSWLSATQSINPKAETVELIASSTPLGIIDVALALHQAGKAPNADLSELTLLRKKVAAKDYDDRGLQLLDALYVAGAVGPDVKSGELVQQDAPLLVAMALAGNKTAEKTLDVRRRIVDTQDTELAMKTARASSLEIPIRPVGDILSDVELQKVAALHLSAVHTTVQMPEKLADGSYGIHTRAQLPEGTPDQYPRTTSHWSLNHPVVSHMYGEFDGLPVTVIAPVEEMLARNGSPASLYPTDTFFSVNPSQEVIVAPDAQFVIFEDKAEDAPYIEQVANAIRLKNGPMSIADLAQVVTFCGEQFPDNTLQPLDAFVAELAGSGALVARPELLADDAELTSKTALELKEQDNYEVLLSEEQARLLVTSPGLLEKYAELQAPLREAIRITLVNGLIRKNGGKVIHSDANALFVNDALGNDIRQLAASLHINSSNHISTSESNVERAAALALHHAAGDFLAADKNRKPGDYNWEHYTEGNYVASELSNASWQSRRMIVSLGLLSYAKPPDPKLLEGAASEPDI